METAILMGLIGIGYLVNNSNRDEAHPSIHPEINTPSQPSNGDGGILYVKNNGKSTEG